MKAGPGFSPRLFFAGARKTRQPESRCRIPSSSAANARPARGRAIKVLRPRYPQLDSRTQTAGRRGGQAAGKCFSRVNIRARTTQGRLCRGWTLISDVIAAAAHHKPSLHAVYPGPASVDMHPELTRFISHGGAGLGRAGNALLGTGGRDQTVQCLSASSPACQGPGGRKKRLRGAPGAGAWVWLTRRTWTTTANRPLRFDEFVGDARRGGFYLTRMSRSSAKRASIPLAGTKIGEVESENNFRLLTRVDFHGARRSGITSSWPIGRGSSWTRAT